MSRAHVPTHQVVLWRPCCSGELDRRPLRIPRGDDRSASDQQQDGGDDHERQQTTRRASSTATTVIIARALSC
eukprot:CAMPEP_0119077496 /NCGR_PEP_ID=MMETSP1178-20130426/95459_1 /TAXON_ID=33656 /ORGANISM="unid sp, Strain CCMP2000" /LENGTH=72 /DNA_ID=CAMNT_0007059865 /DNA_START=386 /DNA_END=604 /DNA_ORIENTATION=-